MNITIAIGLAFVGSILWFVIPRFGRSEHWNRLSVILGILSIILAAVVFLFPSVIPLPSKCVQGMCILKEGTVPNTFLIEGDGIDKQNVGANLVVYAESIPDVEIPIALLRVVSKNPNTLVGQAILIHPSYRIDTRLRVDRNVALLSTSELIPASESSLGYLLNEGRVRLKPGVNITEDMLLEAFEPQLIGASIADYLPFKPPVKMSVKKLGTGKVIADVELVSGSWPIAGTIVSFATSPADMYPVVYKMLDQSHKWVGDCPSKLSSSEWTEFSEWLTQLEFRVLPVPEKEDLEAYRDYFVNALENPPADGFSCGVVSGDLLIKSRALLVDFEITEQRALDDAQAKELAERIGTDLDIMKVSFLVQVNVQKGFETDRLKDISPEKRMFFEYLFIWMTLFGQEKRSTSMLFAQAALLRMDPNSSKNKDFAVTFEKLHQRLLLLSRALTKGDISAGRYDSEVAGLFLDLVNQIGITEQDAKDVGGQSLADLISGMRKSANPGTMPTTGPGNNSASITAEEQAHIDWLDKVARTMQESEERFTDLLSKVADNPSLMNDSVWLKDMIVVFQTWKSAYQEAKSRSVPPSLQEVHAKLLSGLKEYDAAGELFLTGDREVIDTLKRGKELIRESTNLYQQWKTKHGK